MSECNCGNSRCCVPKRGERGLKGKQGDIGLTGPQGPAGDPGPPAIELAIMVAQGQPSAINLTAPGVNTARLCDAGSILQIMPEIIDEDSAYDPVTGIWACPTTGVYNLNFWVHISDDAGLGTGRWKAGIMHPTSCNFYAAGMCITDPLSKHLDITGSNEGVSITAGTQVALRIINVTDKNYVSKVGDVAKMSIQRIR